jgi:hypothetical protein
MAAPEAVVPGRYRQGPPQRLRRYVGGAQGPLAALATNPGMPIGELRRPPYVPEPAAPHHLPQEINDRQGDQDDPKSRGDSQAGAHVEPYTTVGRQLSV